MLRRMRNLQKGIIENFEEKPKNQPKKEMSIRDMLAITRSKPTMNESDNTHLDINKDGVTDVNLIDTGVDSKKTAFDQTAEENKFRDAIKDFNVDVDFKPIEILDNSVVWNGTIDNQIQWSFLVTPDENLNGAKFNFAKNFDDTEPDNQKLIDAIRAYYDDFYKYWRDNEVEQ